MNSFSLPLVLEHKIQFSSIGITKYSSIGITLSMCMSPQAHLACLLFWGQGFS